MTDAPHDDNIDRDIAQREVQAALRVSRHHANRSPFDVARLLGWSVSKVLQSEQSSHVLTPDDLQELIRLYGLGPVLRDRLLSLTEAVRAR